MMAAVSPAPTFDIVLARIDRAATRHTSHPRHLHPALDLKYVQAGLAERGIDAPLLDGWLTPFEAASFANELLARHPRIVVIKAVSWCIEESVAVACRLRSQGVVTVAVGQQVRHGALQPPAGWDKAFDLCIDGEPEEVLPTVLVSLLNQCSSTERVLPAMVTHPDALAVPVWTARELAAYPFSLPWRGKPVRRWGYVLTAWGCPRPCTHCTAIVRKSVGRPLRVRSIERVVDEVAGLAAAGAEAIVFEDDSLFVNRARFLELAAALQRRGLDLPWLANARPDELDDEVVAAARDSGARLIKLGVDSGSPRMIESISKSRDGLAWVLSSREAVNCLDTAGIGSITMFVVGLPGETSADVALSLDLALELPSDYIQVQLYRAYPDVELSQNLDEQVRVITGEYHYGVPITQCSAMSDAELMAWPKRFYRRFYLRRRFFSRHLRQSWRAYVCNGFAAPFAAARHVVS